MGRRICENNESLKSGDSASIRTYTFGRWELRVADKVSEDQIAVLTTSTSDVPYFNLD